MGKKRIMLRHFSHLTLLLLLKMFVPAGCAHAGDSGSKGQGALQDAVEVDPSFDFSAEKDVWVEVSVNDLEGAPAGHRTVEVLEPVPGEDGKFRVIERGFTDDWGNFDRQIRIPGSIQNLMIRVGVKGIANTATVPLDSALTLHHEFG